MKLPHPLNRMVRVPKLSWARIVLALAIALGADGVQLITGPFGWVGLDQAIDVITMILIGSLIGFHVLLLPTFVLELLPVVDDFPTWTVCTIVVIFIRRRQQRAVQPPLPPTKPTIEI
jgi:hypothetical protein